MDFLLKISLMSLLMISLLPGQNSQTTENNGRSRSASLTPLINITTSPREITCVRVDRFNPDHLLICTWHALYRYNIPSNSSQLIAGDAVLSGYNEGTGSDARFNVPSDVVQLNKTALIISDSWNHCLRLIINTVTSTFAGKCTDRRVARELADENVLEARFSYPLGLLLVKDSIYMADRYLIRRVNLTSQLVSTLNFSGMALSWVSDIHYLTCGYPDCDMIYFTFINGLASVKRSKSHTVSVIAGTASRGSKIGFLNQTNFNFPLDLVFINSNQILIADSRNDKIVQVDLTLGTSSNRYENLQSRNRSMICYNGTLYIGANKTLYSTSIIDDFNY